MSGESGYVLLLQIKSLEGMGIDDGALGNLATESQQMAIGNKGYAKGSQDGSNIRIIKAWLFLINPHIQTDPAHIVGFHPGAFVVWIFQFPLRRDAPGEYTEQH